MAIITTTVLVAAALAGGVAADAHFNEGGILQSVGKSIARFTGALGGEAIEQTGKVADRTVKSIAEMFGIPPSTIDKIKEAIGNFINGAIRFVTGVDLKARAEEKKFEQAKTISEQAKALGIDINPEQLRAGMKELKADGAPKSLYDIESISSAFSAAADDDKLEIARQLQKIAAEGATPDKLTEVFEYQKQRVDQVSKDLDKTVGTGPKQGIIPDWVPLVPKRW
jgi:transposase-like protein